MHSKGDFRNDMNTLKLISFTIIKALLECMTRPEAQGYLEGRKHLTDGSNRIT